MKVTIRPLVESDAYTSVKWRNDPEVFKPKSVIRKFCFHFVLKLNERYILC